MVEQDLRALLAQLGVIVECAALCAERVSQTGIVESADFNQMMLFIYEAGAMCKDAEQQPMAIADDKKPRFSYPPRVIYPRPEMARAALRLVGSEDTHAIANDGAGRATIVPIRRAENAK